MRGFKGQKFYQKILYWIGRNGPRVAFQMIWRLEIRGEENIPKTGGVLLASNHVSLADPPLIGACAPRTLYFFAKEELFRIPVLGWFIRQVNAFPVKRYEHDVGAFKRAQTLLQYGQAVVLFPEGRRSKTGDLGKAKPGIGMLAYKAKVPVVPVCVLNSNHLKRLKPLKVWFGKPIHPDPAENEKECYQEFSDSVLGAIADLRIKMLE